MDECEKKMWTDGKFGKLYIVDLGARSNIVPSHKLLRTFTLGMNMQRFGHVQQQIWGGAWEFKVQVSYEMGVSENSGFPPKSSILIGFSIIFTIHFGVFPPNFWKHPNIVHLKVLLHQICFHGPLKRRLLLMNTLCFV